MCKRFAHKGKVLKMVALCFFIALTVLLFIYYQSSKKSADKEYVRCVEAGPTADLTAKELERNSFYDRRRELKDADGHYIDRTNLERIVVKGGCMAHRGIPSGSQLLVDPIRNTEDFSRKVKEHDILMIYIADKKIYKIRELDHVEASEAYTFCYNPDGSRHNSSKPHKIESVKGVVRYRI